MKRGIIVPTLVVGLVLLAGCSALTSETLSFEASSAGVGSTALAEAGYGTQQSDWQQMERTVTVAGQERTLQLRNYVSEYRRDLGDGDESGFAVVSTPNAKVAGQAVNPLGKMSDEQLIGQVPSSYGSIRDLQSAGSSPRTILGQQVEVTQYTAVGDGDSGPTDLVVSIARFDHGDDLLIVGAVHPVAHDETKRLDTLFANIEHPLSGVGEPTPTDDGEPSPTATEAPDEVRTVSIEELTANPDEYRGERVRVRGYYSTRSTDLLFTDYRHVARNEAPPANSYVPLEADEPVEKLSADTEAYTVVVEGVVRDYEPRQFKREDAEVRAVVWAPEVQLRVRSVEVIELEEEARLLRPEIVDQFELPEIRNERSECRFAVITSGGIRASANYQRYWDGVVQTYNTMNGTYGIPDDQIYVNYWNGTADAMVNGRDIVDGDANQGSVDATYEDLEDRIEACERASAKGTRSEVMIFTYNHGGRNTGKNLLGSQVFTPDELRDHLVDLRIAGADEINIMMMQCYSGHFIELTSAMSGRTATDSATSIATAARNDEVSWGKSFGWEFVAALAGAYPDGTSVSADTDGNGEVSWGEAFVYAERNDKWGPYGDGRESPQFFQHGRWIDPDGDGVHSDNDNQPNTYNPDQ